MARNKGAVGYEIGTSKLGAYGADVTIDIFEEDGYIKYKDLDLFFGDCYFEFETKLNKDDFIRLSKANVLKHPKYKEFLNNEVKMCAKCRSVKPLSSFYYDVSKPNKRTYCSKCCDELNREWKRNNKDKTSIHNSTYYNKNKEEVKKQQKRWREKNKNRSSLIGKRYHVKKILKEAGYKEDLLTREKLDLIINLKVENKINSYKEVIERFKVI